MSLKDEKDRLGDKLRDVERGREDHYFAKRDRELIDKMKAGQGTEQGLPPESLGYCPKCGARLQHREFRGAMVDECGKCGGLWLDKGELEAIASGETEGWVARWLRTQFPQD